MATKKTGAQLNREINEALGAASGKTKTPSQVEYEQREERTARGRLAEIERAPLADRKEAQAEFLEAMKVYPALVAERMEWLLNGTFGRGEQILAQRIIATPRMNRSAALTHMVGAFEWQCPQAMAIAAWKKLSKSEQAKLETAVQKVIKSAEREA